MRLHRKIAAGVAIASLAGLSLTAAVPASASAPEDRSRWVEQTFVISPQDAMFATHDGTVPLIAPFPSDIPRLTEPALRNSLAFGGKMRNSAGQLVGIATELEHILPDSDLPAGKLHARTLWTVYLPGRGSITFDQFERSSEAASKIIREAIETGSPWEGDVTFRTTDGDSGQIVGGSEEFAGIEGSAYELNRISRFDPQTGELVVSTELHVRYRVTSERPRARGPWVERSFFAPTPDNLVFLTHNGEFPISAVPASLPWLSEPALRTAFAMGAKAENARGEVIGFTTELEFTLPESDPAAGKLRNRTLWTLFIPGRGAILFNEQENQDEFVTTVVKPALETGVPWVGDFTLTTTVPGTGVIVGGTGEFAGITGTGRERGHLRRFDPQAGVLEGTSEVRLRYRLPR